MELEDSGGVEELRRELRELRDKYEAKIKDIEGRNSLLKDRARKKIMQLQTELEAFRHSASVSDPTAQRLPLNHSTDDQGERSDSLDKPEDLLAVALLTSQLTESKERMKALESEYQLQIAELKAQIHHAADDTGKITQVSFKV